MPTEDEQTVVYLGNRKAIEKIPGEVGSDADPIRRPLKGKRCTTVTFPTGTALMAQAYDITGPQGFWANVSDAEAPAWVASTNPVLASLLAEHYGCELREPNPTTGV